MKSRLHFHAGVSYTLRLPEAGAVIHSHAMQTFTQIQHSTQNLAIPSICCILT